MITSLLSSAIEQNRSTVTAQAFSTTNPPKLQNADQILSPLQTFLKNTSKRIDQISLSLTGSIRAQMQYKPSNISRYMSEGLILKNELKKIKAELIEIIMSPEQRALKQIVPMILDENLELTVAPIPAAHDAEEIHMLNDEIDQILLEINFIEPIDLKKALITSNQVFERQMNLLDGLSAESCDEPVEVIKDKIISACVITAEDLRTVDTDASEYYRENLYEFDRINFGRAYINSCSKVLKISSSVLSSVKSLIDSLSERHENLDFSLQHIETYKRAREIRNKFSVNMHNIKENPKIEIRPRTSSFDGSNFNSPRARSSSRVSIAHSYSPEQSVFIFDDADEVNQEDFIQVNIYIHGEINEDGYFEIRGNGPKMSQESSNIMFDKNQLNHSIVKFPKAEEEEYEFYIVFVCNNGAEIESKTGILSYRALLDGHITINF